MSNRAQRKEKIKAKQRTMQQAKEIGLPADERQTSGLDEVLVDKGDAPSASETKAAVNRALAEAEAGADVDPRMVQLFRDFKRYRVIVVVIIAIGFAILLASMGLYRGGTIDEDTQTALIIFANIIVVVGMVIAFGRARPIREDINAWNKVNSIALQNSGGKHGATEADVDKIFLQRARNRRVPPTPEFARIRRVWYALVVVGSLLILLAIFLARGSMQDVTVPVVIIVISFVLLLAATIIERRLMKPQREAWLAELDARVAKASRSKRK